MITELRRRGQDDPWGLLTVGKLYPQKETDSEVESSRGRHHCQSLATTSNTHMHTYIHEHIHRDSTHKDKNWKGKEGGGGSHKETIVSFPKVIFQIQQIKEQEYNLHIRPAGWLSGKGAC